VTAAADRRSSSAAALEAVATAAAGAALAGLSWSLVDLTVPAAIVGGLSGVFAGWRGIYGWPRPKAVVAFVEAIKADGREMDEAAKSARGDGPSNAAAAPDKGPRVQGRAVDNGAWPE